MVKVTKLTETRFELSCDGDDEGKLNKAASLAGKSVDDFLRDAVASAIVEPSPSPEQL